MRAVVCKQAVACFSTLARPEEVGWGGEWWGEGGGGRERDDADAEHKNVFVVMFFSDKVFSFYGKNKFVTHTCTMIL